MSNNKIDEYSKFRRHLIRCRNSAIKKNLECTLTLDDLKDQWEKQGGRCIYTDVILDTYITTDSRVGTHRPHFASLDRIDSSKGYIKDNIQFISMIAQFAKNDFSEHDFKTFIWDAFHKLYPLCCVDRLKK